MASLLHADVAVMNLDNLVRQKPRLEPDPEDEEAKRFRLTAGDGCRPVALRRLDTRALTPGASWPMLPARAQ